MESWISRALQQDQFDSANFKTKMVRRRLVEIEQKEGSKVVASTGNLVWGDGETNIKHFLTSFLLMTPSLESSYSSCCIANNENAS